MSFLGFLGKALIGTVGGFITGGPVGAIAGGAASLLGKSAGSSGGGVMPASPVMPYAPRTFMPTTSGLGAFGSIGRSLMAGGSMSSPGGAVAPAAAVAVPSGDCNIRGHHLNRAGYYTKGGSGAAILGSGGTYHPKGTVCVKNRHMNVGNARALRKALRRAYGFEKLAMRTIRLLHPTKHGRFGGFKRTRSRARR